MAEVRQPQATSVLLPEFPCAKTLWHSILQLHARFCRTATTVSHPLPPSPHRTPPAVVLDTNVVFDWLVFGNPGCGPLVAAIEAGRLQWIATQEMRDELAHVLSRGVASAYSPDLPLIDAAWLRLAKLVEPPLRTLVPRLRCTDPDDQKFIELALHEARWLVTRDRAVLKLGKRAAALGVTFTTPERWMED